MTYGKGISDNEIFKILSQVGADFVYGLPEGLDTIVGERGSRLSMGQRQLVSFARALITNPKILMRIFKNYEYNVVTKTCFIVGASLIPNKFLTFSF